jgi:hypothetical protein
MTRDDLAAAVMLGLRNFTEWAEAADKVKELAIRLKAARLTCKSLKNAKLKPANNIRFVGRADVKAEAHNARV